MQRFDYVLTVSPSKEFAVTRLGVIMTAEAGEPREAQGVLNPAGIRAPDGTMHLFPRLVAEGNHSRIGHARVCYEGDAPVGVERLGIALESRDALDAGPRGGGVEDPRVVYMPLINRYVMTYTAFVLRDEPRIAIAVSEDLRTWQYVGLVRFEALSNVPDLNRCGNKDAAFFPDVIFDPEGVPSLGILHRPTTRIHIHRGRSDVAASPSRVETRENMWISYVAVDAVLADITNLTSVRRHERMMAPEQPWEADKVGAGAPPLRLPYGWVLPYHAVSAPEGHPRYCMGVAILDLERPSRVLFRTPSAILEPQTEYERNALVADVVFPTAGDLRADRLLDVYYGAADRVIAVARVILPAELPTTAAAP